jgi:hypothetical protein
VRTIFGFSSVLTVGQLVFDAAAGVEALAEWDLGRGMADDWNQVVGYNNS